MRIGPTVSWISSLFPLLLLEHLSRETLDDQEVWNQADIPVEHCVGCWLLAVSVARCLTGQEQGALCAVARTDERIPQKIYGLSV